MNSLIVSTDAIRLAEIRRAVESLEQTEPLQLFQGSLDGQTAMPCKGDVDLLLLDCSDDALVQLTALERLASLYPRMNTILLVRQESSDLLLRALRMGVREVIRFPLVPEELANALRRVRNTRDGGAQHQGKVLTFISCKGGSGSTFIATNLAYALAAGQKRQVLLIDLNLQFGDAALFVSDGKPPATVTDVAREIQKVDAAFLRSSTINVLPNYGVLAAPEDPTDATDIRPVSIETLIRIARTVYDYVVVDIGRALDGVSLQALDMADHVFPVFQLTMPFIRDGRRLMELFRTLGYSRDKVRPLVNRHDPSDDLTIGDLESAVGCQVYATIPNHYPSVTASVNHGVPIQKLWKNSPVTRSLQELAQRLTQNQAAPQRAWLSRIFQRD